MIYMKNRLSFEDWSEKEVHSFLSENMFLAYRQLPTGEWIGMLRLAFTTSVCMDITPMSPFSYRWCFADPAEAFHFYETAVEYDEVPKMRTSLKGHRYGSNGPRLIEYDDLGFPKW